MRFPLVTASYNSRLGTSRVKSGGGDNRTTFLTAIAGNIGCRRCHTFEVVILSTSTIETFRAESIAQFFGRNRQMTAPAAQRALALGQQFESRMFARSHLFAGD